MRHVLDGGVEPQSAEASRHFQTATDELGEGHEEEAATAYLRGATLLGQTPRQNARAVVYNRRVGYANAINLLIHEDCVEQAREVLTSAATTDAALATELRRAAQALPKFMACTPSDPEPD